MRLMDSTRDPAVRERWAFDPAVLRQHRRSHILDPLVAGANRRRLHD
jgi:hypothetical protein